MLYFFKDLFFEISDNIIKCFGKTFSLLVKLGVKIGF